MKNSMTSALLALATAAMLACTMGDAGSDTYTISSDADTGATETGGDCSVDFNEPCHEGCECFTGNYGSVCMSECCEPVVSLRLNSGQEWSFTTTDECMVSCVDPDFTCPSGMVCNTTGPSCVWPT